MKFSTALFSILLLSLSLFAQNKNADNAVQNFLANYNERKFDDIYKSFSASYQQKISKKDLNSYLNQIYGMAGNFKSANFKSFENGTYNYFLVAKNEDVNADVLFIIDEKNSIKYLNFKRIGGTGNPPPVSRMH